MEEEVIAKKKTKRKWVKYILLSLMALLFLMTIIFPPIYSRFMLRPMIETTFAQVTNDAYHLEFDKLRWNFFKSYIFLNQIRVDIKEDSSQNQNVEHFYLDTLIIKNIHYLHLLNGHIKIKSIDLKNLDLKINLFSEKDSILKLNTGAVNRSGYFNSLELGDFNLDHLNLYLNKDGDSLMSFSKADFNVFNFYTDSLNNPVSMGLPLFNEIRFSAEKILIMQNSNQIKMRQLSFWENQSKQQAELDFAQLQIENTQTKNKQLFEQGIMSIDSIQWIGTTAIPYLKGHDFNIKLENFQNTIIESAGLTSPELMEVIDDILESMGIEFEFDNFKFQLQKITHESPQTRFQLHDLNYHMKAPLLQDHAFEFDDYQLMTGSSDILQKLSGDHLSYDQLQFNEGAAKLTLEGFEYQGLKLGNGDLTFNSLILEGFNPRSVLENEAVELDAIRLYQPRLILEDLRVPANENTALPFSLAIVNIEVFDGDFEWKKKGLNLLGLNLKMDSLRIPESYQGPWQEVFQHFQLVSQSAHFQLPSEATNAFIGNLQMDSRKGRLYIEQLDISSILSEKRSKIKAQDVLLRGLNWKEILNKSKSIEMDTLQWSSIDIEGSLDARIFSGDTNKMKDIQLICQYLNLPNINAHVELETQEKPTQLLMENLNIVGESIDFNLASQEFLQYNKLDFSSGFTSFAQSLDSFLISTEYWHLDILKREFRAQEIHFQFFNKNEILKTSAEVFLDVDGLLLSGLKPFLFSNNRQVQFDSINILHPRLQMKGKRFTPFEYQQQSQSFFHQIRDWVQQFKSIGFQSLNLDQLKLDIDNQYFERRDHIEIDDLDLLVDDFYVDYASFQQIDRFLFYENLELEMNGYFQSINNGERLINLQKGNISSLDNRLYFQNFRLLSLGDSIPLPLNLNIQDILLKDLSLQIGHQNPHLYLGSMFMGHAVIELKDSKLKNAENKGFNLEKINLFPYFQDQLSSIKIDQIELNECNILSAVKTKGFQQDIDLQNINFKIEGVLIDSNNMAFTENKFLYSDDVRLRIPHFSIMTPNRFYNLSFQELNLSSRNKIIRFDSLALTSRYDRKTFAAQLKYQKDQVDLMIPSLLIENIDYRDAIFRERYKAGAITINNAQLNIYKDKTIPPDTSLYKTMPAQMLSDLGFYLNVDTLLVNDGYVKYEEFNQLMNQNGLVFFDHIKGKVTGISNDVDFRSFGGALKMDVSGRLMAEANFSLHALFPLNTPRQEFLMIASMESLKASTLNPLIQPLTLLSAKDGYLEQMQMSVSGNDDFAYGDMLLKYEDLKVEVLNKNLKESQLASFLANSILIKKNNISLFPRRGAIYFERVKYRSPFHYLSHFVITGAKTSIGIDQRKTARKIKNVKEKQ